jgi:hypothetical protein
MRMISFSRSPSAWSFRLVAARAALLTGARRRGIEQLFAATAAAFGSPAPQTKCRGAKGLLRQYALFTREQAGAAIDWDRDLQALDRRLFDAGFALGSEYRRRLRVRGFNAAMAAARIIYRGLGIDFKGRPDGEVEIRKCAFAAFYAPRVCALVSSLDRGLLAALTGGGEMKFRERLTEGAAACLACITGGEK